jgi:Lectin C-type domain
VRLRAILPCILRNLRFALFLLAGCTQDFDSFVGPGSLDGAVTDAKVTDASIKDAPATDSNVACTDPGAVLFQQHCYFYLGAPVAFVDAKSACTVKGAHLVTITSAVERDVVNPLGAGNTRWIGLQRSQSDPPVDLSYFWITNEPRNNFNNWATGEPAGTGTCARMRSTGEWRDDNCSTPYGVVCERE